MKIKALKRLNYGLSVLVLCFLLFSIQSKASTKRDTIVSSSYKVKTIIVDAGHGDKVPGGGRGSQGADGSYSNERTVTLAIALKLQKAIEKSIPDLRVVMTRTTPDDVPFKTRSDIANQNKGDLFISIHCNSLANRTIRQAVGKKKGKTIYKTVSVPNRSGKGVLMMVYDTKRTGPQIKALNDNLEFEGGAQDEEKKAGEDDPIKVIKINQLKNKYRRQSMRFAELVNNEFIADGRKSEGFREKELYVLDHTAMPSLLVEVGYINNFEEEDYLNSEIGQNEIVGAIVRGIQNYKNEAEQIRQ